jgi:hypothetical protein
MKYLETGLNEVLLKSLLGESPKTQNTVYICGEARTHCVKSSAIDLLEYARKNKYDESKIVFIKNASSPIMFTENDILRKMTGNNSNKDEAEFAQDEAKTGFSETTKYGTELYKMYGALAMTTMEIISQMSNKKTRVRQTWGYNIDPKTGKPYKKIEIGGRRRSRKFGNKRSRSKRNRRTTRRRK